MSALIRPTPEQSRVLAHSFHDAGVQALFAKVIDPTIAEAKNKLADMPLGTLSHEASQLQGAIQFVNELHAQIAKAHKA